MKTTKNRPPSLELAKWSIADYHRMIETGILAERRVEFLEGEIIQMSPEGPLHRKTTDSVAEYLREIFQGRAKIYEAHPITLGDSEPQPDIAVVKLPTSLYDTRHPHPEEVYLLIEVADTTLEKDLEYKQITYARANIIEYWVVNVEARQLIVFQQSSATCYQIKQTFSQGTLYPLAFPDLAVSVEALVAG